MIKSTQMREKFNSTEELPLNQAAREIGQVLVQALNINRLNKVEQPYRIERIGEAETRENFPPSHQSKRHLFWGEIGKEEIVIEHYSDISYCQDPDYFKRMYQGARDFYGGQSTEFTNKKLGPKLLGCDDETMTLIIERCEHDLTFYFSSTDEEELRRIIESSIDLFKKTWESSKEENNLHPRYVRAFLVPEYFFLEGKKVEDYLKNRNLISLYKQTQEELEEYLRRLEPFPFQRGFGFPDVQPSNLVEDKEGNVLFIDVAKPEYAYHWLNQLGQLYQGANKKSPSSLFTQTLEERALQLIESAPDPELAVCLFALGRMNRLLILCTLRNIVYNVETGQGAHEQMIRENLTKIGNLMKSTSAKEIVK